MFAINHAATALLFKRRYSTVSLVPVLLAVQAMEFAWVLLNYLGVERTTTESEVRRRRPSPTRRDPRPRNPLAPRSRCPNAQRRHRARTIP
jgi:hypothetical protein